MSFVGDWPRCSSLGPVRSDVRGNETGIKADSAGREVAAPLYCFGDEGAEDRACDAAAHEADAAGTSVMDIRYD